MAETSINEKDSSDPNVTGNMIKAEARGAKYMRLHSFYTDSPRVHKIAANTVRWSNKLRRTSSTTIINCLSSQGNHSFQELINICICSTTLGWYNRSATLHTILREDLAADEFVFVTSNISLKILVANLKNWIQLLVKNQKGQLRCILQLDSYPATRCCRITSLVSQATTWKSKYKISLFGNRSEAFCEAFLHKPRPREILEAL